MGDIGIRRLDRTETVLAAGQIANLAHDLTGTVLVPGDANYDTVRRVWNGMVNKRPGLIAQCANTQDVVTSVRFASAHDLLVSVRGGGHSYAGASVSDGGMMIDLSTMRSVTVDPVARRAVAEGGVLLGELDAASAAHGLATTLGVNTDTGIAGLTLGGGYGWLAGRFGLACDNLVAAEMVTADGSCVFTSEHEAADLLWGLRGGGANLGVVTKFHYRLHPVTQVFGGLVLYPIEHAHAALRLFDAYSAACGDEVSTGGFIIHTPEGTQVVAIGVCYSGPLDGAEQAVAPLFGSVPVQANLLEVQAYTRLQSLFDAAWPPGRLYYAKSAIARRLSDEAIACLLHHTRSMPTTLSAIALQQLHGAAARVGPGDTAFPHRFDHLSMYVHSATDDPGQARAIVDWGRRCWSDMQPFMEPAVYVNGLEDLRAEGELRVRQAYGLNYDRLIELKSRFDPTNFFPGNLRAS